MEQVHYELQGQSLIVYVTKELDHHAVINLRATSDKLIQAGNVKHIIFDFSDVDFMDSSGIGLIMGRHKKVMFLGGKTAVTGVGKNIDRIFRMSGLYQIVEKYVTPRRRWKICERAKVVTQQERKRQTRRSIIVR